MTRTAAVVAACLAAVFAAGVMADEPAAPTQGAPAVIKGPRELKGKVIRVEYPEALLILNVQGQRYVVQCQGPHNSLTDVQPGAEVQVDVKQWLLPLKCISGDVHVVGLEGVEYTRAHRVRIEGQVSWVNAAQETFRLANDHRLFRVPNIATIRNGSLRPGFYGVRTGAYVQVVGLAVSPTEVVVRHLDIRTGGRR
jgi:hypothetical protein